MVHSLNTQVVQIVSSLIGWPVQDSAGAHRKRINQHTDDRMHHLVARVQVMKSGGSDTAYVDWITSQPRVGLLNMHIRGTLGVPSGVVSRPAAFKALLDSGSDVTSISETMSRWL